MVIAHLGIAVSLAGMASESAFTKETLVAAPARARPPRSAPISVRFDGVEPVAGPNWTAIEARLTRAAATARRSASAAGADVQLAADADQRGGDPDRLTASSTSRSARRIEQGRWQLRLWWKPFVTLIWLGGALVALGGLLVADRPAAAASAAAEPPRGGAGMKRRLILWVPLFAFAIFLGGGRAAGSTRRATARSHRR